MPLTFPSPTLHSIVAHSAYEAVRTDNSIVRDGWYYAFLVMVVATLWNEVQEWYRSEWRT